MCTSIVYNGKKTLVGWNLDILNIEHQVVADSQRVFIAINDKTEGWLPLFGVNRRGDFIAMPTCWPFDDRSNPQDPSSPNIIIVDIDLLLEKRTLQQTRELAENTAICSVPNITYMAQLSDRNGNVLQIIPGQGCEYLEKPKYSVLTNFSPYKWDSEKHRWMGMDRYNTAVSMLKSAGYNLNVAQCFDILKATSQTVCPTVVSMVYDAQEHMVYWCYQRDFDHIFKQKLEE